MLDYENRALWLVITLELKLWLDENNWKVMQVRVSDRPSQTGLVSGQNWLLAGQEQSTDVNRLVAENIQWVLFKIYKMGTNDQWKWSIFIV